MKSNNKYDKQIKKSKYKQSTSTNTNSKPNDRLIGDLIDSKFDFIRYRESNQRLGWLLNYLPINLPDESNNERNALDLYFIDREGNNFKSALFYDCYFYLQINDINRLIETSQHIMKRIDGCKVDIVDKEDLDLINHLSGRKQKFIKLSFTSLNELTNAKSFFRPIINENKRRLKSIDYELNESSQVIGSDPLSNVIDMREYDINYPNRVAIDCDLRVGAWYIVTPINGSYGCTVEWQRDMLELCEPRILAFDIECEKSPLKFPNAERDRIFMISYMTHGQGYLLINREVVSEDISDFEYTPLPKYPGPFKIFNLTNEEELLRKFVLHVQELKPHVIVTYNGDFFDWPYVLNRCNRYDNLNLYDELGIKSSPSNDKSELEFTGRCMVHLDAFCWVQRDSYLPQGNQGLKAVTRSKLGYDPVEVDPEDMLRFAVERPDHMASYSVSDAVATFYLYTTYVHNFIFSLSTIIPMSSEDVLRKGSGTLCEALLMVEAYKGNIIAPNKQNDAIESFHRGHLLESETYIGGHVECLEAGVFRSDIPSKFTMKPSALQQLIDRIDRDLSFAIEIEHGLQRSDVINYEDIRQNIIEKLEMLRDCPIREEKPVLYHLDVGAMYPNIILTNRLQPSAMVSSNDCAGCDFNRVDSNCKRNMAWTWRGEYSPASLPEYHSVRRQLSFEKSSGEKAFNDMSEKDQSLLIRERLKHYSNKVYKKTKVTSIEERINTVCQRENPFYVNTVRAFRDRRYDYKLLTKEWKSKKNEAEKCGDLLSKKSAEDKEILMDSLQLAHKCILNSFYGYVMRKGARWRSMEMAGIVTHTGAQLIMQARELIEQVGRPLELDTDGIWCILPSTFPQDFKLTTKNGKSMTIGYPCAMLNADVHDRYTNHQYQDLAINGQPFQYDIKSECSIFFELDGPYRAMILPASPEEGRLLKKKYVVFNLDGSLAELKGFELKRRGELEIVKIFQSQVFDKFLAGNSLIDCYQAVGSIANQWLDVLDNKGVDMNDDELLELISERKTISKTLDDYEGRKATSLTTAGRLADFLGSEMVKDKGLNCNLIISKYPNGAPVTERAIPVAIFNADDVVKKYYLRKWLKDPSLECIDFREVVDWSYYKERLGKTIQKIITIPAGMQRVLNPVPRIQHPVWLQKTINDTNNSLKQMNIKTMFQSLPVAPKFLSLHPTNKINNLPIELTSPPDDRNDRKREIGLVDLEDMLKSSIEITPNVNESKDDMVDRLEPLDIINTVDDIQIDNKNLKPETNFNKWLKSRQSIWKNNRLVKKKLLHQLNTHSLSADLYNQTITKKKPVGVADFVRNASLAAMYNHWQIIEIQSTYTPGEFNVWAMTSKSQLQRLKITIPRLIYVNCAGKLAEKVAIELDGIKVQKDLPHDRQTISLYEINIPEKKYIKNEKTLSMFLSHPSVEGVYESQVPLIFRGIMTLGCVAVPKLVPMKPTLPRAYKLKDFDFINVNSHPYLDKSTAIFKKLYIYLVTDRSRNSKLAGLGLFIVDSSNQEEISTNLLSAKAFVWLVSTSTDIAISKPPFQRLYRKHQSIESASVKFTTSFSNTLTDAFKSCDDRIASYSRERNGPTIVIAQGSLDNKQWRKSLPSLLDYPLATMPGNSLDDLFPSIGWQVFVAERMIQRWLIFPVWFNDRLNCSRHSHIPVCNLGNDSLITMIDVQFARILHQGRHLLWASEEREPDIGGSNADVINQYFIEDAADPCINEAGVYRSICIELDVYGLAVSSIMNSASLDTQGLINNSSSITPKTNRSIVTSKAVVGSSDANCGKAFSLLKAIVSKWMDDFNVRSDPISDSMLTSLYRYICGYGDALLYDKLIYQLVNNLMVKLFKRLTSEFKRLGTKIIFADFNRIIVDTKKKDVDSAKEYIDFILLSINNNDIFNYIEITPKDYWLQLIWLDVDNFGGLKPHTIKDTIIDANDDELVDEDIDDAKSKGEYDFLNDIDDMIVRSRMKVDKELDREEENNQLDDQIEDKQIVNDALDNDIISNWSIVQYLPDAAQQYFHFVIGEYMRRYRSKMQHYESIRTTYLSNHKNNNTNDQIEDLHLTDESIESAALSFIRSLISETLTTKMLSLVDELAVVFQHLPSRLDEQTNRNVALDFVLSTTHVLGVDNSMVEEIASLKRTLLAQLRVREFSSLSVFVDPSPSYMMKDIICSYCSTCRDIDLLKKSLDFESTNRSSSRVEPLHCSHCQSLLDMEEIENRLIDEIERLVVSFHLQDFRCPRTKQSSSRLLTSTSSLAATLQPDISISDISKKLERARLVAENFRFDLLIEIIDGVIINK